jgi:hypothetical protein
MPGPVARAKPQSFPVANARTTYAGIIDQDSGASAATSPGSFATDPTAKKRAAIPAIGSRRSIPAALRASAPPRGAAVHVSGLSISPVQYSPLGGGGVDEVPGSGLQTRVGLPQRCSVV